MMNTIYFFNNEEIPKSTYYRKLKLYPSQCRKERCEDKRYESFEQSSPNESEEENVQNSDEMVSFDSSDECGSYIYSSDECDDDNPINIGGDLDFDSNYYGDNDQDVMEEEIEEEEEKIPNMNEFQSLFKTLHDEDPQFKLDYVGEIVGVPLNKVVLFVLDMKRKHRIQDAVLDDFSSLFNLFNKNFPKSFKTIKSNISKFHHKELFFHCRKCGNNCSKVKECSNCQTQMKDTDRLLYQPLSSIIKFKMRYDIDFSKSISETIIDKNIDWWGSESKRIIELFEKKKVDRTIYVSLYSDGLSLSKSSQSNAYPQLTTILNLPKEKRFISLCFDDCTIRLIDVLSERIVFV